MLYYLSDGDCELVASLMEQLAHEGRYEVPAELLARIQEVFACGWADEDEVRAAIGSCWRDHRYVIDPHTACGYHVLGRFPPRPRAAPACCFRPRARTSSRAPWPNRSGSTCPRTTSPAWRSWPRRPAPPPPVQLATLQQAAVLHDDVVDVDGMASYVEHACHAKLGQR